MQDPGEQRVQHRSHSKDSHKEEAGMPGCLCRVKGTSLSHRHYNLGEIARPFKGVISVRDLRWMNN